MEKHKIRSKVCDYVLGRQKEMHASPGGCAPCTQAGFGAGSRQQGQAGLTQQLWLLVGQDLIEDVVVSLSL